jgi:hypothetical protein
VFSKGFFLGCPVVYRLFGNRVAWSGWRAATRFQIASAIARVDILFTTNFLGIYGLDRDLVMAALSCWWLVFDIAAPAPVTPSVPGGAIKRPYTHSLGMEVPDTLCCSPATHPLTKSHGPGGGCVGIRGGSVLAFWRRFFWIAAEVEVISERLVPRVGGLRPQRR